jgi:hypothetical protein
MRLNALGSSTLLDLLNQIQRRNATAGGAVPTAGQQGGNGPTDANDPAAALMEALSGILGDAAAGMPAELLAQGAAHGDPRLFFQAENQDAFLNAANSVLVGGGELDDFLVTAKNVKQTGGDLNKFYAAVQNVMNQGDYDDLDRFLSVANVTMATGNSLEKLYQLTSRVLGASKNDYESVIFAAQSVMMHGASLTDFEKILDKTNFYGFEGRNNLVDFHRVLVTARKAGIDMGDFLAMFGEECAAGTNGRDILNEAMSVFKLRDASPDFNKFKRIERVDSSPMTITQGESAALFCQVVSTRDGLLSGDYVCWSSEETGAIDRGNYLDLSKLGPGTYHFVAKVDGGGDTAIKTVIILPKAGDDGNNGHGNDPGKVDPSNPGNSKPHTPAAGNGNNGNVNGNNGNNGNTPPAAGPATDAVTKLAATFQPGASADTMNPLLKMFRLYQLNQDSLTPTEVYDFIDKQLGAGTSAAFLRSIGANQVAEEYERRDVKWESLYAAQIANPDFYEQISAKFRSAVTADEAVTFLRGEGETDPDIAETLWLLGYRTVGGGDGNNGHGNDPGKVDLSNPGQSKFLERLEKLKASAMPEQLSDAEIESLFAELIDVTKQIEEIDRLAKAYAALRDAKNAEAKREQQRQFWDQLMAFINKFLNDQADASRETEPADEEPQASTAKPKPKDEPAPAPEPPAAPAPPAETPTRTENPDSGNQRPVRRR